MVKPLECTQCWSRASTELMKKGRWLQMEKKKSLGVSFLKFKNYFTFVYEVNCIEFCNYFQKKFILFSGLRFEGFADNPTNFEANQKRQSWIFLTRPSPAHHLKSSKIMEFHQKKKKKKRKNEKTTKKLIICILFYFILSVPSMYWILYIINVAQ